MKNTKLQFKVLRVWLRYYHSGYSVGQWVKTCWKSWLMLGGFMLWSYYFVAPTCEAVGWGFFGLCLGAFLRDVGYYQVSRRTWPLTRELIDWKRVQELIDAETKK